MRRIFCLMLLVGSINLSNAQVTKVFGQVFDAETKETLPFASVTFPGTETGTITDMEGKYRLQSTERIRFVEASFIGYELQTIPVEYKKRQRVDIYLKPSAETLTEIELVYEEDKEWVNPAHVLLENLWANSDSNALEKYDSYSYRNYEKIEFDFNNLSEKFINRRILRPFRFAFDFMDTSALSGKNYLPILLIENDYNVYYKKDGKLLNKQLDAARVSGFDDAADFNQFTGNLYQDIDVYDNQIILFDKSFASPLSTLGLLSYNYYLTDSVWYENQWCYEVRFIPRRKQELTFKGSMWIHDSTFALQKIEMQVTDDANFNWVNDLYIRQEFKLHPELGWLLYKDHITMDFSILESRNVKGIYGKKTAFYTDHLVNIKEIDVLLTKSSRLKTNDELERPVEQWDTLRPVVLTETEAGVQIMMDSIQGTRAYRTAAILGTMITTGYYGFPELGIQIGPFGQMLSFNAVEGTRLGLFMRTFKRRDDKFRMYGHLNYGTKDQKFKGGLGFKWVTSLQPRIEFGLDFNQDMELFGRGGTSSRRMTFANSLLSRNRINELAYIKAMTGYIAFEPVNNLSFRMSLQNRLISPRGALNISYKSPDDPAVLVNRLNTSELNASVSWTPGRTFFGEGVERRRLFANFATFGLRYKQGFKGILSADFDYKQLVFDVYKPLRLGFIGNGFLRIEAGKTFGTVPYPLMSILPGNETVVYRRNAFNLMNFGEFVADEYTSAMYEHHFEGVFFNKIPLIRHLQLREVISAKAVIGTMSAENRSLLPNPDVVAVPNKIYYEVGGGVENIFKVFRVEAVWRLSYLDRPEITNFAILGMVHIRF